MRQETLDRITEISSDNLSFYQRADAIARLFGTDDSAEIVAALDPDFRADFIVHAQQSYAPGGPRLAVAGEPLPQSCLQALRTWTRSLPTRVGQLLRRRVRMTYHQRDVHLASVLGTPQGRQGPGDRDEVVEGVLVCRFVYFLPTHIWMCGILLDSGEVEMGHLNINSDLINIEITHTPSQWDGHRNGDWEIAPLD